MKHHLCMIAGMICKIGLIACPGTVLFFGGYNALDRMVYWEKYYDMFKKNNPVYLYIANLVS